MYNRYIPDDAAYRPVAEEKAKAPNPRPQPQNRPQTFGEGDVLQRGRQALSSLWQGLRLNEPDAGDILLLLIVLLLLADGDELDLVIALGLVFVLGFGDKKTGTA